jgi:glucose/arabinose dehydrogenase
MVSTIARFGSPDGGATLDAGTEAVLLSLPQPFSNHNGGHILFGPDGFLYAGFGDGGGANDPMDHGQNPDTLFATLLRLDVDRGTPYAIPPDNPFAAGGGRGEVWAYGLRNPWRFSFDPATGQLWAADVGQDQWEEIDIIVGGGNYGWNIREGAHCFGGAQCDTAGLLDPVAEYDHSQGCSITGGFVYRGSAVPALTGAYVYGDFCSGNLWALDPAGTQHLLAATGLNIASFAEDAARELLIVDLNGALHRILPEP